MCCDTYPVFVVAISSKHFFCDLKFLYSGADPGFFLGGCALVSCSTSTPINHTVFFWQNTSCIRKLQVISGEGGAHPQHPPPRSAPDMYWVFDFACLNIAIFCNHEKRQIKDPRNKVPIRYVYMFCNRFCPKKLPVTLKIVWNNFIFLNYAFFVVSYFVILKFHWKYPLTLQNKCKIHLFS